MDITKWSQAPWSEGRIIRGKYRILSYLGSSAVGYVYKAEHLRLKSLCALKVLGCQAAYEGRSEWFERVAILERKLPHPNAVRVEDFDQTEDEQPFMVMEFVEGETLRKVIEAERTLSIPRAGSIARQVASALAAAHELGIIHRGIDPDNIMLVSTRQGELVKVLDFGMAKVKQGMCPDMEWRALTGRGIAIIKPAYMSPEQVTAKEPDRRSDIYSLGIVMYQMLTGQLPFPQEADWSMQMMDAHLRVPPVPIGSVRADIPEALASLVMKCLEKSPDRRPETCSVLVRELEAFGTYGGSQVSLRSVASSGASTRLQQLTVAGVWRAPTVRPAMLFVA